jgi:site-specific DNA recombinase
VRKSNEELVPRNGHTLCVLVGARISGCANQKEISLDDQVDNSKEFVCNIYIAPVDYTVISTVGKGEALDRPELERFEAAYRSGKFDLAVYDEISRLIRGVEAKRFLGIGVDHGTRSICLAEDIDTADDTWEEDVINACGENVAAQNRTSHRIKTRLMHRFRRSAGPTGRPISGYIIPEGAKTYLEWLKDETATPIVLEAIDSILNRPDRAKPANCSAVARFFNNVGFAVGPYARRAIWNGQMAHRFLSNPLLKGIARRGVRHSVKNFESGRRKPQKNPAGPKFFDVPHLAHVDPERFDLLQDDLKQSNARFRRPTVNGRDSRLHIRRKQTRLPGQLACCWYCGREYVWGGNGISENLMCSGAREWRCWNSIGFNGPLAARKLADFVFNSLQQLQGVNDQFAELVHRAQRVGKEGLPAKWEAWRRRKAKHEIAKRNVQDALREFGARPLIKEQLDALEAEERQLALEKFQHERHEEKQLSLPPSVGALSDMMNEEFSRLSIESYEFADRMRSLISNFSVHLIRLVDGGRLFSRAKVTVNLGGTFPDVNLVPELHALVTKEVTIDLWDQPAQREQIRVESVQLAASGGLTRKQIGQRTTPQASGTAVIKALALNAKMTSMGLSSPWQVVYEPPSDMPKLRRHKNAEYQFVPLEDYYRSEL